MLLRRYRDKVKPEAGKKTERPAVSEKKSPVKKTSVKKKSGKVKSDD